jgi:type II secretory pathway pseudopilin PulG
MKRHMSLSKMWSDRPPGYVLIVVMLVLMVVGVMAATFAIAILRNDQHVARDRAYSESLAVAEAGLNQYLWMIEDGLSSEANEFVIPGNETADDPHTETLALIGSDGLVKGSYTIQVEPPSSSDSRVTVKITGMANSPTEVPRTVRAHIGRPAFSEYLLLVNQSVYIGGPLTRVWHGKTHSNTGIRIETANITDTITCAQSSYQYGNKTKPGIWSDTVASTDASRSFWLFPVPVIDFNTVTSDFTALSALATGVSNLPYAGSGYLGYYIKLLSGGRYQVAKVTAEYESKDYASGNNRGGYLTYGSLSAARSYPDSGVIYVNDDVWVEGTGLTERITIASSGQLNPAGQNDATSINIVGDLTYSTKDGSVSVGLIGQNNVEIPMYAPMGKAGTMGIDLLAGTGSVDMEVDAAIIAQQGKEFVNHDASNGANMGPRRNMITFFGSVSSNVTPYRCTTSANNRDYAGFAYGANTYDRYLLHNPPPHFPTIGSYQILDWQELPSTQAVAVGGS